MSISHVCSLFCHFVKPFPMHLFFPFNIYACVGKNKNLHLLYTPETQGVICVFQRPFPFFSPSVHCLSDKFRCLWHRCVKWGEEESGLPFSSLWKSVTRKKKGKDEQLPKSFIQSLVFLCDLCICEWRASPLRCRSFPSRPATALRRVLEARCPPDRPGEVYMRYSCQVRSGLDTIYFFTLLSLMLFISFVLSHTLC